MVGPFRSCLLAAGGNPRAEAGGVPGGTGRGRAPGGHLCGPAGRRAGYPVFSCLPSARRPDAETRLPGGGGLLPEDQAAAAGSLREGLVATPAGGPPSCGEAVAPSPFPGSFVGGARGTDLFSLAASISQAEPSGWKEAGAVGSLSTNVTRGKREPPVLYTRARRRGSGRRTHSRAVTLASDPEGQRLPSGQHTAGPGPRLREVPA